MKKLLVFTILLALGAVLAVSGCGRDDSPLFPSDNLSGTPYKSPVPASVSIPPSPAVFDVVSVTGPIPQISDGKTVWNPGGPVVEVTLHNGTTLSAVSLNATLHLNQQFVFNFDVSESKPLPPGGTISSKRTLIGGGFSDTENYTLAVYGTMDNGLFFIRSEQVTITAPAQ